MATYQKMGRGPNRGLETREEDHMAVSPIVGPVTDIEGSPMRKIARRRAVIGLEEKAFLKKGREARGTLTARQSGARALAIRHFEEAAKGARDISDYRAKRARI